MGDLKMRDLPMTTFIGEKPIKVSYTTPSNQESVKVELSAVPLHNSKWAAVRGKEIAEEKLREVIHENIKRD